ncbi:hypothetical protein ACFLEY_07260 [Bradyrhizobium sp. YCK136]|uniref:hypothetical protein n=1 Tax=Bradyrhizobium sp. YCK136 TaxID=3351346 RepID=UPI0037CC22EB
MVAAHSVVVLEMAVEQARQEAAKILAKAELGHDVALDRARERAEMTIAELCDEYLREGVDHKKSSTLDSDNSRIECHIRPLLGGMRIPVGHFESDNPSRAKTANC